MVCRVFPRLAKEFLSSYDLSLGVGVVGVVANS